MVGRPTAGCTHHTPPVLAGNEERAIADLRGGRELQASAGSTSVGGRTAGYRPFCVTARAKQLRPSASQISSMRLRPGARHARMRAKLLSRCRTSCARLLQHALRRAPARVRSCDLCTCTRRARCPARRTRHTPQASAQGEGGRGRGTRRRDALRCTRRRSSRCHQASRTAGGAGLLAIPTLAGWVQTPILGEERGAAEATTTITTDRAHAGSKASKGSVPKAVAAMQPPA